MRYGGVGEERNRDDRVRLILLSKKKKKKKKNVVVIVQKYCGE